MKARDYVRILHGQILIVMLICILGVVGFPAQVTIPRIEFVLDSTITCASTFSGFTLTVVSILLGFSRSTLIEYLKEKGGTAELILRYTFSLVLGVVIILFCLWLGSTLPVSPDDLSKISITKCNAIIGLALAFAYLYNLISSGMYLLRTIALATAPVTLHKDEAIEPEGEYRI